MRRNGSSLVVSANDDLFDAQVRHEIAVRRFTARQVRETLELLDKANRELEAKLVLRLRQGDRKSVV